MITSVANYRGMYRIGIAMTPFSRHGSVPVLIRPKAEVSRSARFSAELSAWLQDSNQAGLSRDWKSQRDS